MKNDDFYIGWQDQASAGYKKARTIFFRVATAVVLLFGVGYLIVENEFVESYFYYGRQTELEGVVVEYPVFGIRTEVEGKQVTVPLVGFGKFDALPVLQALKDKTDGLPLSEFKVRVKGTIFRYQDKTWMELTDGVDAVVSVTKSDDSYVQAVAGLGDVSVSGEIVDPKCFFGVMNPAYKKIHRSCAIRCVSGGIPPVLAIRKEGVFADYYFLVDQYGKPLNREILQFVGVPVTVSGKAWEVDDWKVVGMNAQDLLTSVTFRLDGDLTCCE